MATTGEKIRAARLKAELTQEQLAKKAKLNPATVSRLEASLREPEIVTLQKIARALRVPAASLRGD